MEKPPTAAAFLDATNEQSPLEHHVGRDCSILHDETSDTGRNVQGPKTHRHFMFPRWFRYASLTNAAILSSGSKV
jgi:hypothetical protein